VGRREDRAISPRQSRWLLVTLALAVCAPRAAHAGEDFDLPTRHRLGLDLGLGSALGVIGVGYQYAVDRLQRVEAGVGWGFSGVQLSGMYKLGFGGKSCRFIVGLGASLALGGAAAEGHGPDPFWIPWLNLDAPGFECHTDFGLSFQGTLGATMPLVRFHYDFVDTGGDIGAGKVFPQARFGVGWWL
jgi:hypothetical protein